MDTLFLLGQASDEWADVLFGLEQDERFALLIVTVGCATGIIIATVGIVSGIVHSIHRHNSEMRLKQEMLDRGMSADEIAKVIESSQPQSFLDRMTKSGK